MEMSSLVSAPLRYNWIFHQEVVSGQANKVFIDVGPDVIGRPGKVTMHETYHRKYGDSLKGTKDGRGMQLSW